METIRSRLVLRFMAGSGERMDPVKKFRIIFWITFSVLVIVIGAGTWLFLRDRANKEQIISEKDQKISELEAEISKTKSASESAGSELEKENEALKTENIKLAKENSDLKAAKAKALTYNEFLKYMTSIIKLHAGFSGWTDAEFQTGKAKAEATGNANFVSTINWAWYQTSVPPTDRVIRVWEEAAAGIENSLK